MSDLNKTIHEIEHLLLQESMSLIKCRGDVALSQLRRNEMHKLLDLIDQERSRLSSQIHNLPELPDETSMNWAEWILSLPNLAILVLDTTSLDHDSDIISIYALRASGMPIIDITIAPRRQHTANTPYTGLTMEELAVSPLIEDAWPQVLRALRGHFIVSFTLEFVEGRLKENIAHYGLDRLPLRGDCLMKQCLRYFSMQRYGVKLAEACARVGHKLPTPALAQHRAEAQLALLKAMANGATGAPPEIDENTDLGTVEDHPF